MVHSTREAKTLGSEDGPNTTWLRSIGAGTTWQKNLCKKIQSDSNTRARQAAAFYIQRPPGDFRVYFSAAEFRDRLNKIV